eukprot:1447746-Rhodomonas_salina.1
MGFTRMSVVYVNDAWGRSVTGSSLAAMCRLVTGLTNASVSCRGYVQDATESAREVGVDIVVSARYELGDQVEMEDAI